jgi:2-iminobutanoate/2-iminopropanoate deaminase
MSRRSTFFHRCVIACASAVVAGFAAFDASAAGPEFLGTPAGMPFSSAVRVDNILYLSGEIGQDAGGKLPAGLEAQTRQTMENIAHTLKANGKSFDDVFKCTVLLTDMSKWADFNKVYVTYFKPGHLPARSAIGANGLALGALVEVECWAWAPAK